MTTLMLIRHSMVGYVPATLFPARELVLSASRGARALFVTDYHTRVHGSDARKALPVGLQMYWQDGWETALCFPHIFVHFNFNHQAVRTIVHS